MRHSAKSSHQHASILRAAGRALNQATAVPLRTTAFSPPASPCGPTRDLRRPCDAIGVSWRLRRTAPATILEPFSRRPPTMIKNKQSQPTARSYQEGRSYPFTGYARVLQEPSAPPPASPATAHRPHRPIRPLLCPQMYEKR